MSASLATVASIATAPAQYPIDLVQSQAFARRCFATMPALERLLPAFEHTGIDERQIVRPLEWYAQERGFAEKNALWEESAFALACVAARRALAGFPAGRHELGAVVFVSSTGIATPSLDARMVAALDLPRTIARVPLWGLGCAGGAAGLARAAALCRGLQRPVLVVAVEICSATFMAGDRSRANLIASALFGDGAAAAVLVPGGSGPTILGGHSQLLDGTEDVMGWDVRDDGLAVRFLRSIPTIVREVIPGFVDQSCAQVGLTPASIVHWALHPGGAKVLEAYAAALGLPAARLAPAHAVLREHGNMSSPTALFVLERILRDTPAPERGGHGLVVGLGPGFSAEAVVFAWSR